jgi:hypothetical protein
MTTLYSVTIHFRKNDEPLIIDKVIDYQFASEATMFWVKRKGTLIEGESRFVENMEWYPAADIEKIEVEAKVIFDTKREIFEWKRDRMKGVAYVQK